MSHKATSWAWSQKSISYMSKLVLLALADRFNADTGDCFPSIRRLETDCCMSRSSILRSVDELEKAGLITAVERRDKIGRNKSNQYQLHIDNHSPEVNDGKFEGVQQEPLGCPIDTGEGVYQTPKPVIDNHTLTTLMKDDKPPVVNDGAKFWDEAVGSLLVLGLVESTARQFTGRCLKWAKGDQQRVLDVFTAALNAGPRDPIPYISKILSKPTTGLEKKRSEYNEAVAELMSRPSPDGAWNNYGKWTPEPVDDTNGTREQDSECVYSDPFAEPDAVYEVGGGSVGDVRPKGHPKTRGPKGGYLGEMQIPSLDI